MKKKKKKRTSLTSSLYTPVNYVKLFDAFIKIN